MLYQLKYRFDRTKVDPVSTAAANFLKDQPFFQDLDAIIPVPPSSTTRPFQPVFEIALAIGSKTDLPVYVDFIQKVKSTEPLKSIDDSKSRRAQLEGAFRVKDDSLSDKNVLLIDDLFRSGETLSEITRVLKSEGEIAKVYVLTITKTRTRR